MYKSKFINKKYLKRKIDIIIIIINITKHFFVIDNCVFYYILLWNIYLISAIINIYIIKTIFCNEYFHIKDKIIN